MYIIRIALFRIPFPFSLIEETENTAVSMKTVVQNPEFKKRLHRYRSFHARLDLHDDTLDDEAFYEDDRYVSGLVMNDTSFDSSKAYADMHLQFAPMPSLEDEQLRPVLDVYGFMANQAPAIPMLFLPFCSWYARRPVWTYCWRTICVRWYSVRMWRSLESMIRMLSRFCVR